MTLLAFISLLIGIGTFAMFCVVLAQHEKDTFDNWHLGLSAAFFFLGILLTVAIYSAALESKWYQRWLDTRRITQNEIIVPAKDITFAKGLAYISKDK